MYVWKFDEDQRVFREIPEAEMNADRDGIYVTRRARHAARAPGPRTAELAYRGAWFHRAVGNRVA